MVNCLDQMVNHFSDQMASFLVPMASLCLDRTEKCFSLLTQDQLLAQVKRISKFRVSMFQMVPYSDPMVNQFWVKMVNQLVQVVLLYQALQKMVP